ncbi:MAG: hypothetical protein EBT09_02375 [Actinobacteria bacterium]|nr:hypothetical protein [Actinomycetota bacterium]
MPKVDLGRHRGAGGVTGSWSGMIDVGDRLPRLRPQDFGVLALGDARGWLTRHQRRSGIGAGQSGNMLRIESPGMRIRGSRTAVTTRLARSRNRGRATRRASGRARGRASARATGSA